MSLGNEDHKKTSSIFQLLDGTAEREFRNPLIWDLLNLAGPQNQLQGIIFKNPLNKNKNLQCWNLEM